MKLCKIVVRFKLTIASYDKKKSKLKIFGIYYITAIKRRNINWN